jgi:nucleotide-binding universal stress UspA family protein
MGLTVLLCTDGSELADTALADGLAVLGRPDRLVIATVIDPFVPPVVGIGVAPAMISPYVADQVIDERRQEGQAQVEATCRALGKPDAEITILTGAPGPALCELAASLQASVVVIGTRGRGGLRRAVLGSVSDHVVRNAPCPVVVTGPRT